MKSQFRILAGFSCVVDEAPTIDTAMDLAQALEAEVAGCFVEDTDLLNLAALPFAKAVGPADRSIREVELSHMERTMSRAASSWRRALNASAEQARIRCSYQTMRGAYSAEIGRMCAAGDVVVLNPVNIPHHNPEAVSRMLRQLKDAAGTVLLPDTRHRSMRGPVVLMASGGAGEWKQFELAERIAREPRGRIEIIALPAPSDPVSNLLTLAREVFGREVKVHRVQTKQPAEVAALIADLQPSFTIVRHAALEMTTIGAILRVGRAPLLVMSEET